MATKEQIVLKTLLANDRIKASNVTFATSLANCARPSAKQEYWIKKIVEETISPLAKKSAPTVDISKIVRMFTNAKKHLKFPKVHLRLNDGQELKLGMAGANSKYAGSITCSSGSFGNGLFYGAINPDSTLFVARDGKTVEADLIKVLTEFAANPEFVAARYGKITSRCCFCQKKLSTPESLAVGYGPDCAEHFELAWGKEKLSSDQILDLNTLKDKGIVDWINPIIPATSQPNLVDTRNYKKFY